jgi:Nitronate monooxygenase
MILLPRVAEELKIPFVASGGMADGRSLVAALALGADGINMGTRFIATQEAPAHDNVKRALVAANELQTRLMMRPLRNTERVLTKAAVEEILAIERDKGVGTTIDDIRHLVGGAGNRRVLEDGEMDAGAWELRDSRGAHPRHSDLQGTDRLDHGRSQGDHQKPPRRLAGGVKLPKDWKEGRSCRNCSRPSKTASPR